MSTSYIIRIVHPARGDADNVELHDITQAVADEIASMRPADRAEADPYHIACCLWENYVEAYPQADVDMTTRTATSVFTTR